MVDTIIKSFLLFLERRCFFVFFGALFKIVLEFGYINFVVPVYSYSGFILDFVLIKYIETWLLFIFMLFIFPNKLKEPSDFLMVYIFYAFLTPLLCYYSLTDQSRMALYLVLFCVTLIAIFRKGRPLAIKTVLSGQKIMTIILITGSLVVTIWMFASGGLTYFNLDFTKVYEFRKNVGQSINVGPMSYFNVWATKVFGPTLLALSLWKKRFFYAFIIIAIHVIWFGISSHRSVLFYPLLVIFLYFWFKNTRALSLISIGMTFPVIIAILLFFVFNDIFLGGLVIRRVFFVPASLTFTYFDFFSSHPFVFWSNNITSYFIEYPYLHLPAKLIGEYLDAGEGANNSFFSTGYMHAGIFGVIIYGAICGILFRLVDTLSTKSLPNWVTLSIIIVPSHSLIMNSDLPTSILTHGLGMSLLVLFFLRSRRDDMREGIVS